MANYENIKDANSKRTPSERREIARIAGKASGKARRRKANMRETANRLLTMVGEVEGLSDILRADGGESTYEEIITMAMIQKAAMGDVKAYEALKSTVGQTDKSDADLEEHPFSASPGRRSPARLPSPAPGPLQDAGPLPGTLANPCAYDHHPG